MKRKIAYLLTLIIIFAVSNAGSEGIREWLLQSETATPTVTPAPNAFRFRDGIRWGMNNLQVKAFETEPMTERSMQEWSIMFSDGKVVVSRFTADLIFMFLEDRLMMISYEFPQGTQNNFQYLAGALDSLYGSRTDEEPLKIKALMDTINPDRYRTELISQACGWTYADGTTVYLYYYSEKDFAIMYVSPEMGNRIYQTNGL